MSSEKETLLLDINRKLHELGELFLNKVNQQKQLLTSRNDHEFLANLSQVLVLSKEIELLTKKKHVLAAAVSGLLENNLDSLLLATELPVNINWDVSRGFMPSETAALIKRAKKLLQETPSPVATPPPSRNPRRPG